MRFDPISQGSESKAFQIGKESAQVRSTEMAFVRFTTPRIQAVVESKLEGGSLYPKT
jgi:hypothetical protein